MMSKVVRCRTKKISMNAEQLIDLYLQERLTNLGPGAGRVIPPDAQSYERRKRKRYKGGRPELEYFGLAGLPGGARNDYDSPDSYSSIPQARS